MMGMVLFVRVNEFDDAYLIMMIILLLPLLFVLFLLVHVTDCDQEELEKTEKSIVQLNHELSLLTAGLDAGGRESIFKFDVRSKS